MANKNLFSSPKKTAIVVPEADTVNRAGGKAYAMSPKHALAQIAVTGCLNDTYYADAETQLQEVLSIAQGVLATDPAFVARVALYARERGFMKDMPALLCAVLASSSNPIARTALKQIFPRVIDNAKMLRTFAQIVRSGVTGRKSFGTQIKRLMQQWFDKRTPEAIFKDSIGDDPSLADVIKMVHPYPATEAHAALFGYFLGKHTTTENLLDKIPLVQKYEEWKAQSNFISILYQSVPDVPFQMLTGLRLPREVWVEIAKKASWHTLRMNLNTFERHGVFRVKGMPELIAAKLQDPEQIRRSRVFPYQLYMTHLAVTATIPEVVKKALATATDLSLANVPEFAAKHVFVCPDISGSMGTSVTGSRKGATSKMTCAQVAAFISAAVLAKNQGAKVLPFSDDVAGWYSKTSPGFNGVFETANTISRLPRRGTNCAAPLYALLNDNAKVDLVLLVSDNESWIETEGRGTDTMRAWSRIRQQNPQAKLICLDLAPNTTLQAANVPGVLNIGGFSDNVFAVIAEFVKVLAQQDDGSYWVNVIEQTTADPT